MRLYHITPKSEVASILREGLTPRERGFIYLWDSLGQALDFPWTEREEFAVLEVKVPRSWVQRDEGYHEFEAAFGHSWRVGRNIPPSRIRELTGKEIAAE